MAFFFYRQKNKKLCIKNLQILQHADPRWAAVLSLSWSDYLHSRFSRTTTSTNVERHYREKRAFWHQNGRLKPRWWPIWMFTYLFLFLWCGFHQGLAFYSWFWHWCSCPLWQRQKGSRVSVVLLDGLWNLQRESEQLCTAALLSIWHDGNCLLCHLQMLTGTPTATQVKCKLIWLLINTRPVHQVKSKPGESGTLMHAFKKHIFYAVLNATYAFFRLWCVLHVQKLKGSFPDKPPKGVSLECNTVNKSKTNLNADTSNYLCFETT